MHLRIIIAEYWENRNCQSALSSSLATFLSADHSHPGMMNSAISSPFSFFSFCPSSWPLPLFFPYLFSFFLPFFSYLFFSFYLFFSIFGFYFILFDFFIFLRFSLSFDFTAFEFSSFTSFFVFFVETTVTQFFLPLPSESPFCKKFDTLQFEGAEKNKVWLFTRLTMNLPAASCRVSKLFDYIPSP